jgi:hypothetical protein
LTQSGSGRREAIPQALKSFHYFLLQSFGVNERTSEVLNLAVMKRASYKNL